MALNVRRDVWSFSDPWDDTLKWYERAVASLKTLPLDDPRSWRYLAAMHGVDRAPWEAHGYLSPDEELPDDLMETSWMQCQHTSWYFLPWHRGYLVSFEAIIRETVAQFEGAPKDWALPYWNYNSTDANALTLPIAFRSEFLPDGITPNSLYVPQRFGVASDGSIEAMTPQRLSLERALSEGDFTSSTGGFGGPKTGFLWGDPTGTVGVLEATPHGTVHVLVGSFAVDEPTQWTEVGLMSTPVTAALDPIFWLHHANIDRLWEVWLRRDERNLDPAESAWVDGPPEGDRKFTFPGPDRNLHDFTVSEIASMGALGYEYDDTSDPLPDVMSTHTPGAAVLGLEVMMEPREFASNETGRVVLGPESGEVRLRIDLTSAPPGSTVEVSSLAAPAPMPRVFLSLDSIRAGLGVQAFDVFVAAPASAPGAPAEHFVGTVSMFGAASASDPSGVHGGVGLRQAIDVTSVYHALRGADASQNELTVRFKKVGKKGSLANVSVGKVSLLMKL